MKRNGIFGLVIAMACAGCASTAGVWQGSSSTLDATALRSEVERTLVADDWSILSTGSETVAFKPSAAGHRSLAIVDYQAGGAGGASFRLVGKSTHTVNWLSFGILGAATKHSTWSSCTHWYSEWCKAHPAGANAPN